ncbi:MAG TPA: GNAT family N-acetyltransferase [Flavobacteriaceae bacterium]|nr:GNAT family N-acetyltransferase [Flavobacteriaceae bacterium]
MSLTVRKYESKDKALWNQFVTTAKNATFLFNRDFMDYHSDRFEDFSLLVFKDDKLVSIIPANRKDTIVYSHQGLTYGGIITTHKTKLKEFIEIFRSVLFYLHQYGINSFEIKLLPSFFATQASDEIEFALFCAAAETTRCDTYAVLDMQTPFSFSKGRNEGIKRGIKLDLVVLEENDLRSFWEILLVPVLWEKHGAQPVHSIEEIALLKETFPDNIRQFNVYQNNKLVAGTTIFETSKVAHSQYIAADHTKNTNGSLDFLHNHLIKNVFRYKNYFDFGTFNRGNGTEVNSGLGFWKQSFGAQIHTQNFYSVKTENYNRLDSVFI